MTAGNAILIIAIVTGLGLIGALFFVMFKIRQISREFFGTSSLIEGFPGVSLAGVEAEV